MKILIVEDESRLAEVLRRGLREEGIAVEWAENGLRGQEMALSGSYDAVVLDVMLPGRNGFELLRRIRAEGSKVPVLMLTARSGLDDRVRGLDLGADDYLPKPFAFKELMARLRAITRRPAVEPQSRLRIADLEIDLGTREVRRGGKAIDLSSREFALLEFLARRKGLVLTRAMILDHVWASDYDYDGGSNLVDVYVNYLRKKVDHGHPVKLIHTIRGAGYVLREPAP
ncbi:response regulator transcription factor [Geothrix paludis]|uniref:response regulator transcription factor n=1 Tax=Geothrix paludis TaxID=2922722 RepID=UPI001FAC898A|nr:response regulator transcription factor [Geothrix paludis]